MKNLTVICIATILLAGCRTHPQPVFNPDQPHVKVVTYNVNWGFVNPPNVINFIAIMSKYKLQNVKLIEPNEGWFPAMYAEAQTPLGAVQILTVHLRPPVSDHGSVTVSAYYNAPDIHVRELKGFIKNTSGDMPLIVAGDFNENESKDGVAWLQTQGLTDALSMYDEHSPTWQWKVPLITLKNRYDHIMLSRQLSCTGAKVVNVNASDHLPVVAVVVSK